MSAYITAARSYVDHGWSPIPIEADGKGRTPGGYTGHSGVIIDATNIDRWLTIAEQRGFSTIGLRMHRDNIGIDVDAGYGLKKGAAQLRIAEGDWGTLPATWSSTARGAGQPARIHFYSCPPEHRYEQQARPDIDVIQFHHRQAVVWPSPHHTGNIYRWYRPDGAQAAEGELPQRSELPALPDRWVEHLRTGERSSSDKTVSTPTRGKAVDEALEALYDEYPPGQYHDSSLVAAAVAVIENGEGGRHGRLLTQLGHLSHDIVACRVDARKAVQAIEVAFVKVAGSGRSEEARAAAVYALTQRKALARQLKAVARWLEGIEK